MRLLEQFMQQQQQIFQLPQQSRQPAAPVQLQTVPPVARPATVQTRRPTVRQVTRQRVQQRRETRRREPARRVRPAVTRAPARSVPQPRITQKPVQAAPAVQPLPAQAAPARPAIAEPTRAAPVQAAPAIQPGGQRQTLTQPADVEKGRSTVVAADGRVIHQDNGRMFIQHNEATWLSRLDPTARMERGRAGEVALLAERPGGIQVITVVDPHGRLLRRIRRGGGRETVLIDNRLRDRTRVEQAALLPAPRIDIPRDQYAVAYHQASPAALADTIAAAPLEPVNRRYALDEILESEGLRARMRRIDLDTIRFAKGTWQIGADQTSKLEPAAAVIKAAIARRPNEVFLIEGHTDSEGSPVDNLTLSDQRAEAVALALTRNFGVPPENLTTRGYGNAELKGELKLASADSGSPRHRVTFRRITPLLTGGQ
jgi:outer membrane protein OmpA-like peptidoglycan-associated protein